MRFGSLFSGIGGIDLGLERAGLECAWQVEIDDYANKVLKKHWPNVRRFRDVREVGKRNLEWADLIAGGFPCQDISRLGKLAGIEGERSGLWSEYYRILCELRPRFALVENVAALLDGGISRVLGDLASIGFNAEWGIVSACAFGAAHPRERVFIVAYCESERGFGGRFRESCAESYARYSQAIRRNDWINLERCLPPANGQAVDPGSSRRTNGLSNRVDRIRGIGNAVIPQLVEWLGYNIMRVALDLNTQSASPLRGDSADANFLPQLKQGVSIGRNR